MLGLFFLRILVVFLKVKKNQRMTSAYIGIIQIPCNYNSCAEHPFCLTSHMYFLYGVANMVKCSTLILITIYQRVACWQTYSTWCPTSYLISHICIPPGKPPCRRKLYTCALPSLVARISPGNQTSQPCHGCY